MNDEQPTQPEAAVGNSLPDESGLSGLTDAVGGLDSVSGEPAVPDHDPLLGKDIGGVTIVKLIAEGGMGRVYEGLQARPRRPVAVKVMRPGFVSREACRRFDNESEVLGRLRHQYIAQIFSAGICNVVGAQVPYFIMEYIPDALPLTKFAASRKLSTEQRLELFRKVCEAVAHGHENNVIHRDLKPSNILVEPSGVPKVIDFGVARCVDATPETMTALTDMGQLIGTVQYMSPEQFSADPAQIDMRTDVYALGVILYELLTGRPPYEIRRKQIFEAAEVVRRKKPVSPSRLNRDISPYVEQIAGTCLQKDRSRRYANATDLADDLSDCLKGACDPNRKLARVQDRRRSRAAWASSHHWRIGMAVAGGVAAILLAYAFVKGPPEAVQMINSLGMTLVRLPRGQLSVHSADFHRSSAASGAARFIRITRPFWIGRHEVTQSQWKAVMGTSPWLDKRAVFTATDAPAVCVSWSDAVAFCRLLTERERATGALGDGEEYRLPTEAEWEYACRAGSKAKYCFGDDETLLGDHAWFQGNSAENGRPLARAVGTRKPNAWGLHDMHGNVWEWVLDAYDPNPPSGDDPMCVAHTERRVLRGGSWFTPLADLHASHRHSTANENADNRFRNVGDVGFRVALGKVIPPPPHAPRPEAPSRMLAFRGSRETKLELDVVGHDTCPVWGSNPYTDDSCLATAAVHAGAVKTGERGTITVVLVPGQSTYEASMANGVQTRPYGPWSHAFRIELPARDQQLRVKPDAAAALDRLSTEFDASPNQ